MTTIASMAQAYESLTGEKQVVTRQFADVLQALASGEEAIIVELPWFEVLDGKTYRTNQLVVHGIKDDRIFFSNPLKRGDEKPGLLIEGEAIGPQRQVHPGGVQSMELGLFKQMFMVGGGQALLKSQP